MHVTYRFLPNHIIIHKKIPAVAGVKDTKIHSYQAYVERE